MFLCVTNAGVDHCAQQDHGCEQLCLNTEDSFVCQCSEGFVINEDLKTCSSEFPLPLWEVTPQDSHHPNPEASLTSPKPHLVFCFAGVDYCLLSDHGCEYACVNTDRSFSCRCPEGHVLRSDGKTCASESRHK